MVMVLHIWYRGLCMQEKNTPSIVQVIMRENVMKRTYKTIEGQDLKHRKETK